VPSIGLLLGDLLSETLSKSGIRKGDLEKTRSLNSRDAEDGKNRDEGNRGMKALKSLGIPSASNPDPGTWRSP
jgi:hypothetical protein